MFIPKIMWDKLIQKECKDWDREGQEACLNKSKGKKRKKKGGEYHKMPKSGGKSLKEWDIYSKIYTKSQGS